MFEEKNNEKMFVKKKEWKKTKIAYMNERMYEWIIK